MVLRNPPIDGQGRNVDPPDLRDDERKAIDAAIAKARADERERCARLVPTNWCDVLLTGPDAARPPLGERGIEALLRGIQDRIRADT
jgi:hypothetical protein